MRGDRIMYRVWGKILCKKKKKGGGGDKILYLGRGGEATVTGFCVVKDYQVSVGRQKP